VAREKDTDRLAAGRKTMYRVQTVQTRDRRVRRNSSTGLSEGDGREHRCNGQRLLNNLKTGANHARRSLTPPNLAKTCLSALRSLEKRPTNRFTFCPRRGEKDSA
jgi:hypothetical protein